MVLNLRKTHPNLQEYPIGPTVIINVATVQRGLRRIMFAIIWDLDLCLRSVVPNQNWASIVATVSLFLKQQSLS